MPDKKDFGFVFPCDGPGRSGTCQTSTWEQSFYLAMFWMLNTIGWVTFYWHWKHLGIWQGNVAQFNESSTYIMGWLRDYLWLYSAQLINGYNPYGTSNLSVHLQKLLALLADISEFSSQLIGVFPVLSLQYSRVEKVGLLCDSQKVQSSRDSQDFWS
jgi:hypothetical protein